MRQLRRLCVCEGEYSTPSFAYFVEISDTRDNLLLVTASFTTYVESFSNGVYCKEDGGDCRRD